MRYTLDENDTFLVVMELGTITAAARMNLSKSVISKRISDLELTLGAALFRRNAGRITPTGAALRLDDRARELLRDLFDIAIRIGHLRDTALMQRKLCEDETIPCANPAYLERHGRPVGLADHQVIGYHHMSNAQLWDLAKGVPSTLKSRITPNNGEAMRDMAIQGLGVAILPGFIANPAIVNRCPLAVNYTDAPQTAPLC